MVVGLPYPCDNATYEARMASTIAAASAEGFTHVAFGDLFLEDVRRYREDRMAGSGLTPIFPLWGRPTPELAAEMIRGGLEAHLSCIDPRVLPRGFAGRAYDAALLRELPGGVDPCGERGEFHTCAIGGPMFEQRLDVSVGEVVEREGFVYCDLVRPRTPPPPASG
jgi:diphthamide synthase (EF-2-diphthine--ammonia ligase)